VSSVTLERCWGVQKLQVCKPTPSVGFRLALNSFPGKLVLVGKMEKKDYGYTQMYPRCISVLLVLGGAVPNLFPKRIGLMPKMGIFYSTPYQDTIAR
jgi:hypothetical protein